MQMLMKKQATSFTLLRYIPELHIYELAIAWETEILTPPTIFYLSEMFLSPYEISNIKASEEADNEEQQQRITDKTFIAESHTSSSSEKVTSIEYPFKG